MDQDFLLMRHGSMQNVCMNTKSSNNKMSKQQLVSAVCLTSGQNEGAVRAVLDATRDVCLAEMAAGGSPYGLGLGKFSVVRRVSRVGRDIRRGTDVVIPERNSVHFKPSQPLVAAVNGSKNLKWL